MKITFGSLSLRSNILRCGMLLLSLLITSFAVRAQQLPRIGERLIDSKLKRLFLTLDTLSLRSPVLYRRSFGPVQLESAAGLLFIDFDSTGTVRGISWIRGDLSEYYSKHFLTEHSSLDAIRKDGGRSLFERVEKALIKEYGRPKKELENSEISVMSWDTAEEHITLNFERGAVRLVKEGQVPMNDPQAIKPSLRLLGQ